MREIMQYGAVASRHKKWELLKSVEEAEEDLAARNFLANAAKLRKIDDDINLAELAVIFGDGNTAATILIYAARNGGPLEPVCSIAAAAGEQAVVEHPAELVEGEPVDAVYADEMKVTGYWYDAIKTADAGGDDGVAKAIIDLYGREYLLAVVTNITGDGDFVDVIFSGV